MVRPAAHAFTAANRSRSSSSTRSGWLTVSAICSRRISRQRPLPPVNGQLHGRRGHLEPPGHLIVRRLRFARAEIGLQFIKKWLLAGGRTYCSQSRASTWSRSVMAQRRSKSFFRPSRRWPARTDTAARPHRSPRRASPASRPVSWPPHAAAGSPESGRSSPRGTNETAPAPDRPPAANRARADRRRRLAQIGGIRRPMPPAANVSVERIPIRLAERRQGLSHAADDFRPADCTEAPMRRGKFGGLSVAYRAGAAWRFIAATRSRNTCRLS